MPEFVSMWVCVGTARRAPAEEFGRAVPIQNLTVGRVRRRIDGSGSCCGVHMTTDVFKAMRLSHAQRRQQAVDIVNAHPSLNAVMGSTAIARRAGT